MWTVLTAARELWVLVAGVSAKRAGLTLRHGLFLGGTGLSSIRHRLLRTVNRTRTPLRPSLLSALDALDTSALQDSGHWDIHNLFPDAFGDSLRGDHFDTFSRL